ncbi:MAG: type VI secretion system-associated protein TagF [Planctomycetota bacterium]
MLEVGCYGKLPLHGDFIRHRAGPELRRIDAWLQEGLHELKQRLGAEVWSEAFFGMPTLRFMRTFADTGRVVIGLICPSHGKVGREFPFLVYATLELRALKKRPSLLPLLCQDVLARAEDLALRGWEGIDLRGLLAKVDALATAVDVKATARELDRTLSQSTVGALWEACLPQGGADERALLLANAHDLFGPRSRPRFPLVLPAPPDGAWAAVLLELAQAARQGEAFPPVVTWSAEPFTGLRAILTEPSPSHFIPLFLPQLESDACVLASEGLESESLVEKARARYGPLAEASGSSLETLLRGLAAH